MSQSTAGASRFLLQISILAFGVIIGAVITITWLVPPADRPGQPLLPECCGSYLEMIGVDAPGSNSTVPAPEDQPGAFDISQSPRFIVRFQNLDQAEDALRLFRENRGRAREEFASWADSTTAFADFRLAMVMPSGEAVLYYEGQLDPRQADANLRRLAQRLIETPGVAYAEPYPFARQPGAPG